MPRVCLSLLRAKKTQEVNTNTVCKDLGLKNTHKTRHILVLSAKKQQQQRPLGPPPLIHLNVDLEAGSPNGSLGSNRTIVPNLPSSSSEDKNDEDEPVVPQKTTNDVKEDIMKNISDNNPNQLSASMDSGVRHAPNIPLSNSVYLTLYSPIPR